MKKSEIAILEKAFNQEVEGALRNTTNIFQSKSKVAKDLADEGLLRHASTVIGYGPFSVTVSGYELTHAGRMLYCMTADKGACESKEKAE